MRSPIRAIALACVVAAVPAAPAQTYTPKQIRIEGAAGMDAAELLRIANLKAGPLTKQEIEAGMQRLADTGLFNDLSYTVDANFLTLKLSAPTAAQALPVRYANFVWWQPAELEKLVEARVPIFHGELPLSGSLTDQVEAALTALLHDKGIDAKVTAMHSQIGAGGIALAISRPSILLGEVHLVGGLPALAPKLQTVANKLTGTDFDIAETAAAIQSNIADIYQNAGYLDVATDAPAFSAPRKDLDRFMVDAGTVIHQGEIYRVAGIVLPPAPPLTQAEINKAADLKTGDPASPLAERIAQGEITKAYAGRGFLDASATLDKAKDSVAHTVAYRFTIEPGEIYHLAGVDTSALAPSQQAAFAHSFHVAAGAVAGEDLTRALFRALLDAQIDKSVKIESRRDRAHHTVTLVLHPGH